MIYIIKGEEPQELKSYRESVDINRSYENFRDKDTVRESLLKEQGFLCAYCMRSIGYDRRNWYKELRIEHYRCRSEYKEMQLDYNNMLAVCTCSEGLKDKDQHCDVSKGNQYIHIDPTNRDHINTLEYSNGEITSTDQQFSEDLKNTLGLNHSSLPIERREALNVVIGQMNKQKDKGTDLKLILEKTLQIYCSCDNEFRKRPFCGIIITYCTKKLSRF